MSPPSLRELQIRMKRIITDPRVGSPAMASELAVTESETFLQRMGIYADAYFLRLLEVFVQDFPRTHQVLGEAFFQKLVASYLREHPSRTHNINEVAAHFSHFVGELALSDELPYLPILIDLEWKLTAQVWTRSFEASSHGIERMTDTEPDQVFLKLNPSLQLINSAWPLDLMWRHANPEAYVQAAENSVFVLFRNSQSTWLQKLSPPQAWILSQIQAGKSLAEIFESFTETFSEQDPIQIFAWFQTWTQDQIISL